MNKKVRLLAEEFAMMNAGDQAEFLNEVAVIFHLWGEEREEIQINAISRGGSFTYGKIWIESVYKQIFKG